MKGYVEGRPFYRAFAWEKDGDYDWLLREEFTTKREAISCIKKFKKSYTGSEELYCFVRLYDEDGDSVDDFDV